MSNSSAKTSHARRSRGTTCCRVLNNSLPTACFCTDGDKCVYMEGGRAPTGVLTLTGEWSEPARSEPRLSFSSLARADCRSVKLSVSPHTVPLSQCPRRTVSIWRSRSRMDNVDGSKELRWPDARGLLVKERKSKTSSGTTLRC